MVPAWSKEFFDIQATTECRFSLKRERGITITYSRFDVFINWADLVFLLLTLNK